MPTRLAPSGRPTADGAIRFPAGGVGARHGKAFGIAAALSASLLVAGCVERTLLLTSDPLGAHATINGKDMGVTPVTVPFVHNQRFEYRIEKPGYRSVAGEVKTPSTWDSAPGIDFFAENAYPGHIRRQTVHAVKLERLTAAPTRAELEAKFRQADAFRVRADTETGGADIPAPTRPDRVTPPAGTGTPPAGTGKPLPAGSPKPLPPSPPPPAPAIVPPMPAPTPPQAGAPASR